jgi:hypothetical protein
MTFNLHNHSICKTFSEYLDSDEYHRDLDIFEEWNNIIDNNYTLISKTRDISLYTGKLARYKKSLDSYVCEIVAYKYSNTCYKVIMLLGLNEKNHIVITFSDELMFIEKDVENIIKLYSKATITSNDNLELEIHDTSFIIKMKGYSFYKYDDIISYYSIEEKKSKTNDILKLFGIFLYLSQIINKY